MARIATDENHHFMFYKGVVAAMLREQPSAVLGPLYRVLTNFEMPGIVIPGYVRRAVAMAKAAVYNLRIHHDRVVRPLLRDLKVEHLTDLTAEARELQEKLMAFPRNAVAKGGGLRAQAGCGYLGLAT